MSCGRPEMHTRHTRNVMQVLWQARNAYRTYIYIYKMRCVSCGRPEMRTGHTRNVMYVLWQTRIAYRTYQKCIQDIYISEMRCMSCGRPEMRTGHTRNVMHVLWQTRISICPRVLQNLPCWKTQKTRNLFQHKILISVLSLSISCCMRRLLQ